MNACPSVLVTSDGRGRRFVGCRREGKHHYHYGVRSGALKTDLDAIWADGDPDVTTRDQMPRRRRVW